MAIQPQARLSGSSHLLRFVGTLRQQVAAGLQTVNGEVPQGVVANTPILVVFALADMTDLADEQARLPSVVYDDSQPAALSPHSNTIVMGPTVSGAPAGKTWAQNVRVRAEENESSTASPLIARIDVLTPAATIDGASGFGLGQGTGIPCVSLAFYFTAAGVTALTAGQPPPGVDIVVEIEVPHTFQR